MQNIDDYQSENKSEEHISSYENKKKSSGKWKVKSLKRSGEKYTTLEEEKENVKNPKLKSMFDQNSVFEILKKKESSIFELQKWE